jgi:fructose-1,6-bisphosphatase II
MERARNMDLTDPRQVFKLEDMVRGEDILFAATGVTQGDMLKGVRFFKGGAETHSVVMRCPSRTVRFIQAIYRMDTIQVKLES